MFTRTRALHALSLGLLALAIAAGAALAQPPHGRHRGMPHGHGLVPLPLLLTDRSITDEQRAQIDEILAAQHEAVGTILVQLDEAHTTLSETFFAEGPLTAADLEPTVQKIDDLRSQLLQQELRTAIAIRNVLTPEQLDAAADRKARLESMRPEIMQFYVPE